MKKSLFEYPSYRGYLIDKLSSKGGNHGIKTKAAEACLIQLAYLSNVLNGKVDLSLEQADRMNDFLLHNEAEAHYFLLLLQKDRAGSVKLKNYFQRQIDDVNTKRLSLIQRLGEEKKQLTEDEKQIYYSSWIYAAIHIGVTIPELQNRIMLQKYLNIPNKKFFEAIDFLVSAGLILPKGDLLEVGSNSVRLGSHSANIIKHHTHWRLQAIESLERETIEDLHYSAVFSLSKEDILSIKNKLLDYIKQTVNQVTESKEEKLYNFNLDFYSLKKS